VLEDEKRLVVCGCRSGNQDLQVRVRIYVAESNTVLRAQGKKARATVVTDRKARYQLPITAGRYGLGATPEWRVRGWVDAAGIATTTAAAAATAGDNECRANEYSGER
jgi:hypothetical protein